jgi:hypothetical protein
MTGTVPANLPAAPIFKHPEQEDEAEGGVLVTIREDAPLDFRARACSNRLGVRGGRRTSGRRAGSAHRNHTGGYEQYTHDGEDQTSQWLSALRRSAKSPSLYNLSSPACHRPHRLGQLASCPRRQECPRARPASERAGRDRDEDVGSVGEGQREANECGRVQPMKALPTVASPP